MRPARFLGLVVALALAAGACGGGDDDAVGTGPTTTAAGTEATSSTTGPDDGAGAGDPTATTLGPVNQVGGTLPGTASGGTTEVNGPAADLTGEEICSLLPATAAVAALGVDDVVASAGTTDTPQCSYRFTAPDGSPTDATVAALRTDVDLGGRYGADAFTFVVDLNVAAAQTPVNQTPLGIGDQSVLLTGDTLYMAVLQLGARIVTVLLNVDAGDVDAVTDLAQAAAVLTP